MLLVVFAVNLHAVEDTVILVLDAGCKYHLSVCCNLKVYVGIRVVGEGESPNLRRAVFQHRDFCLGLDAIVNAGVANLVAGKTDVVVLRHGVERGVSGTPQLVVF